MDLVLFVELELGQDFKALSLELRVLFGDENDTVVCWLRLLCRALLLLLAALGLLLAAALRRLEADSDCTLGVLEVA